MSRLWMKPGTASYQPTASWPLTMNGPQCIIYLIPWTCHLILAKGCISLMRMLTPPAFKNNRSNMENSYHQLHCLTIIRKTFKELASNQTPTVPLGHSRHCFDSLLQYVVCGNSGDTLLYTWGRNQTGDGQLRRCVDWDGRRQWARENTACYVDGDHPIPLYDHFGHCEGHEDDGVGIYTY